MISIENKYNYLPLFDTSVDDIITSASVNVYVTLYDGYLVTCLVQPGNKFILTMLFICKLKYLTS